MQKNIALLNKLFSKQTFRKIVHGDTGIFDAVTAEFLKSSDSRTNLDCIRELYGYLRKNYPNEYFYRNTLFNAVVANNTLALSEIPVGDAIADFALIGNNPMVFEIKTDLDSLQRLDGQINEYYKAFPYVSVLCGEFRLRELSKVLCDSPVGIYVLYGDSIRCVKEPIKNTRGLENEEMFKLLRKPEYTNVIRKITGDIPKVSQFDFYRKCKSIFLEENTDDAYRLVMGELRSRKKPEISDIPEELRSIVYFSDYNRNERQRLEEFLEKKGEGSL